MGYLVVLGCCLLVCGLWVICLVVYDVLFAVVVWLWLFMVCLRFDISVGCLGLDVVGASICGFVSLVVLWL